MFSAMGNCSSFASLWFGVGLCGLANVLKCGIAKTPSAKKAVGKSKCGAYLKKFKNKCTSFAFAEGLAKTALPKKCGGVKI